MQRCNFYENFPRSFFQFPNDFHIIQIWILVSTRVCLVRVEKSIRLTTMTSISTYNFLVLSPQRCCRKRDIYSRIFLDQRVSRQRYHLIRQPLPPEFLLIFVGEWLIAQLVPMHQNWRDWRKRMRCGIKWDIMIKYHFLMIRLKTYEDRDFHFSAIRFNVWKLLWYSEESFLRPVSRMSNEFWMFNQRLFN